MEDNNSKRLYDALSKDYDMGSYEQFVSDIQDKGKRQKLYDTIKEEYELPDFDGFSKQLGITETVPAQTQAPAAPASVDTTQANYTFTEEELGEGGDITNKVPANQPQVPAKYGTPEYAQGVINDDLAVENPYRGMTRQQAINAIGEKYRNEWYGKPDAYQNIQKELAAYNIASPEDYGHITAAVRNHYVDSVARQRAEDILSKVGHVNGMTLDDIQGIMDSRETQQAIERDMKHLGIQSAEDAYDEKDTEGRQKAREEYEKEKEAYYQNFNKQLQQVLVDKYGYLPTSDGRSHAASFANSLFDGSVDGHEERIRKREALDMMQSYVESDINETFKKYDEQAQKEFEKASERALKSYNTVGTSPTGTASMAGSSIGQALYAQHAKESARDYDKIIKDISDRSASIFEKMTNNDGFLKEAKKMAEFLGISPEEYVAKYVVPGFMDAIQRQFTKTAIAREMPKDKLDYIMRGLEDSVVGMLISSAINPKSKIAYRDMANARYGEDAGMWLEGARMAVGMASDFWLWGGWGKIGASATKSLLNMRIMNLAAARGISREAATRMVEEEAKQYLSKRVFNQLMSHMPSSMVTMGGAQASTELVRGTTRGEDDVLLNTVKTGLSSAATGAAFGATGAVSGSITSKLAGWKRLLGKVAGLEVEAGTLYTTEELQKMMAGEDAFQNPYEGMLEANVKLGFIKASANPIESARKLWNAVTHPVKTVKGMAKPDLGTLDEKDVKHIMESAGGKDLLDALTSMRPQLTKENAEREGNLTEEEVLKAAEAYKNFMADADVPWDTKQKVARLHGAIVPPAGYEVSTEIKEGENGETLLITRDLDGQCIRELHFDNPEDAEWERGKINGNTYLNRVSALQERIDAYDAQKYYSQYLTNEYAKIAEKMQQEGTSADDLTPDERQCIYLYQHANELQTARDKMMDGQELSPAEKQLVDIYQKRFIGYTLEGHGHEAFDRQFEREEGLEEGILDKIDLTEHKSLLLEYSDAMEKYLAEKDKAAETAEDSAPMLEQTPRQLEGNAGGEAGGVQSTGANEPSATLEVDETPVQEAPAAEAAPVERNERRQAAYDIGKQAVAAQANLADISYDSQLASLRMQQLFPENDPILSHLRKDIFKALADGNHTEVDRLMDANAGYINARQREAIEQYRDAVEASAGISDGIRQELAQYETQHREMLQEITAQDGNITELALADGSTAYYMSGDLNGQSVMVKNQNGEVIQISTNSISAIGEVRKMEDVLAADIEANQQEVLSTLSSYANGSNFVVGQQVDLSIAGKPFHGMMAGYSPDGSYIFQMEDGSEIPMAPQDAQQAVMEANRQKMEAQLRQEKADAVAEQQAERFGKSISGYAEGKPDLTAKDTDPKAAAEYLMKDSEDGNHAPVLSSIESEIARLNEDKAGNLEVVKALTNKEAMGELTEEEAVSLADARRAIEDADARRRKWGEIRQELMDDNERAKLESARQSDIKNALEATKKDHQVKTISIGEEVPTSDILMERFEEKGDAADHIEKMMAATKAYYRDNLFPQLSQVRDTIRDYRRGLVDLTKDELTDLTRKLVDLESEETYLVNKQQNLSQAYNSLGRLYAQREVANLTPHERKMRQLEKETDREKKLKLAKEAYADDEDALAVLNDTEPQDIYEFVSSNIGAGSINWEGVQRGEHYVRGLRDELGKDKKRGIGKDSDTFGFNYFLAPEGQGKGIEEVVHGIAEGSPYSTEDVRNALIDMLTSASKPTDISHRIVDDRIARAEDIYNTNLEREREAEEEAQSEAQIKAEDAAIMEMTGMTPEEYDAFISDLENRLAAQEGYKTSDEYFNHLTEEYDRQNVGSVGGSQESGTPKEQGKEVEQAGAEAAGETSVADADAVTKVNKALEPITNKYNSLAPIEVVSIDSDEMIAKVFEQMTGEKPSNEDLEEMRQDIKSSKLPAAYDEGSKKIYIFAENFPSDKAEEGFFHENLHRGLHQYYGDGLREVAEEYWNNSTSEQAEANKQRISGHYADQPEKIKEEYLVHTMAVNMVVGRVDKLIARLGEENQEIIENILKNIGYDRTKEAAGRAAQAGETLEEADQKGLEANRAEGRVRDNQAQKPERPAEGTVETKGEDLMDVPFTERLEAAKAEVNTNPTEAEKKAGNYKLGHIRFGGYEMSIENPKGSTRSGVDANGKPWSITMHDTYGYIRDKYGADGDHLDFFINDDADLDKWDGFVFIVDQKNEDGSFDEHKVMYGYPNLRTAKEAYLRNYEDGWEDKHVMGIMGARKADFDKWLADSDHKHKPFAEYFRTKNNNNTIKDNVDQLLADVADRNQKYEKQTKPSYTETQLTKMTKSELVNLKAKRKKDFKTNRYLLSSADVAGSGSAKELQIRNNMAQANADMEAIDAELKRKEVADKERIEQMEMGFAMTDRLEDMGVDVITDPSEIRRGRKNAERDNSEAGKLRHFKTTSGEIYGFSYKDKLYIDIRKINSELPMHEYGHLWAESLRKINPDNWKSVVDLMKGDKDTWEFVKSLNPDLTSEDDIAEEMIAKCSGKRGVARVRKEYERMNGRDPQWKSKWGAIWQNIAKAIQDFWKKVGDYLNIKYESADQVYDQVIRDFANKVNPRKKIEKWLQERDKAYLDAVKAGDKDKAKELFDAALRENIGNGIVPFVAVDGYRGKMQKLAHGVKDRDPKVIAEVADLMTPIIPKDAVLVPAPSHTGEATDMLDLAKAISERTGAPVADVLKSAERGSQYEAKYAGKPISSKDMGITMQGELPEGKIPVVIDNVVDTGNTAEACVQALGKGIVASLADSADHYKHVASLKSAEPVVVDKNGKAVPLSKRFEIGGKYLDKAVAYEDIQFDIANDGGAAIVSMKRPDNNGYDLNDPLQQKVARLKEEAGPNSIVGYVDSNNGDYVVIGNDVNTFNQIIGSRTYSVDANTVRIPANKFDIVSPKVIREGYKMAFANDEIDETAKLLAEVDRRKELASRKESEQRVKEYLDKKVKGDEAQARQRATKAVLKAMDKAGVPYKVVSKEEEREMMQIFSMMNQESVKAFCRRADIRSTSRHGFGRYCVYNMADPFAVPMYHEKLSNAKEDLEQLKRMAPKGAWEILDIGYADEAQDDKNLTGKAADMNLAELQADIETWHGSGAVFTRFDHSHMGEGANSQVFGWGTYLSTGRKVAEGYTQLPGDIHYSHLGEEISKKDTVMIMAAEIMTDPTIKNSRDAEKYANHIKSMVVPGNKERLKLWDEVIEVLRNSQKADFEVNERTPTLYKVNIPDDTGENYLDWMKTIEKPLRRKIADAVRNLKGEPEPSVVYANYKDGWNTLANIIERDQLAYKEICDRLVQAFGGRNNAAEKVSKLMSSIGFVGVKYPAGTIMGGGNGATNYVIFNEDDAKIVDTIQFMMGDEPAAKPAPIFISNALKAVEDIKQEKGTPEQWLAMITKNGGLKAGEDKWLGLSDWLKEQKGSITKQDILDYINKNQINIEDVSYTEYADTNSLSELADRINERNDSLKKEGYSDEEIHDKLIEEFPDMDLMIIDGRLVPEEGMDGEYFLKAGRRDKEIHQVRLGYTSRGLDNKREIALVVPTIEPWNENDEIHFGDAGEGRAVAWVRFGDTTIKAEDAQEKSRAARDAVMNFMDEKQDKYGIDIWDEDVLTDEERTEYRRLWKESMDKFHEYKNADKKVLVIDEIQSKRHQEGREKGYESEFANSERGKYRAAVDAMEEYRKQMMDKYGRYFVTDDMTPEENAKYLELYNDMKDKASASLDDKKLYNIPDAPFDKNWHELAMKRMLRYAAENGYDKIAWTTGMQQAERYKIGNVIDSIENTLILDDGTTRYDLYPKRNFGISLFVRDGEVISSSQDAYVGKKLSEIVGKEVAEKMQKLKVGESLDANNLELGGAGMKGFYDDILPRFMNKYGKKWNVKVGEVKLPGLGFSGLTMHSIDVTPEMKESVMQGQPMFQKEGKKIMGWSDGKQVYLTEAGLNPNTPLHETTHLWDKWCQKEKPELWQKLVDAMKKTAMWEEISKNPNYRNIWNDDSRMASEVHARLSGAKGEDEFMKAAFKKDTPQSIIDEVKSVLKKFWEGILRLFGKTTKTIGDEWSSLDAIIRMPLRDLLNQDFEKVMNVAEPYADTTGEVAEAMRGEIIERTLMGVHNISEEKLRKAIKLGGLANPSMAVIDTKQGIHTDYGEISLIPKASLIDKRKGRNAGTYTGDAWTPTYPHVERRLTDKGDKHADVIVKAVAGDNEEIAGRLRSRIDDYYNDGINRLDFLFLKQKGLNPQLRTERTTHTQEEYDAITEIFGEPLSGAPSGNKEITKEQSDSLLDLMVSVRRKKMADRLSKSKLTEEEKEKAIEAGLEEYRKSLVDEKGRIWFAPADTFIYENWKDNRTRQNPKIDWYSTENAAMGQVIDEGLSDEFEKWKENLMNDDEVEERLFAGYTPSGNRRYLPNTVENASRLMNKLSDNNAYDSTGFSATRSLLLQNLSSLADIRRHKDLIDKSDKAAERAEELSNELFDIVQQISDRQKIDDNPYSNNSYAEARLQEAIGKKNPIRYLNEEYGYNISEDGELASQLMNFMDEVRNLPAKYFETKFKRPVALDEFTIAVVPETTSPEVVKALQDAGLDVRTYVKGSQGDENDENRRKAVMDAVTSRNDILFHIEDNPQTIARLDAEPKEVGYRNVVVNEDGTLGSPMASRLGKKGEGRKATTAFEYGKWERSDEHPELANENGKVDLIKPDGKSVGGVDYNPYIHIRPNKVNKQFKQAWERPNLIYVETEYPASELNGEYQAEKAAKAVGKHKWGTQGESLILSRWDKPVRMVPWEEVADDWEKEFKGRGVEFDIIPPKLLPILAERGVEILPPHKGMGKACNDAYEAWKAGSGKLQKAPENAEAPSEFDIAVRDRLINDFLKPAGIEVSTDIADGEANGNGDMKLSKRNQIYTDNFKKFFGDWEKEDKSDVSKVVDADGKPLVVYHDTNSTIYINKETGENWDDLDWKAKDEWSDRDDWDEYWKEQDFWVFDNTNHGRTSIEVPGFFFAPKEDPYHEYGKRTIKAYLNIKNPIIDPVIPNRGVTNSAGRDAMEEWIRQGYDGMIRTNEDGSVDEYVAFFPNQIKSADQNIGTFDTDNPDIRYLKTSNGEAYGYVKNGKIFIDPRIAKADTPIHEYGHLWAEALRKVNPEEWKNVVKLMKGVKDIWNAVKRDYSELKSEDDIAEEVLTTYSGKRGRERFYQEKARVEADQSISGDEKVRLFQIFDNVKKALHVIWNRIADFLHIHYVSAEQVADQLLGDLLSGVNPRKEAKKYTSESGRIKANAEREGNYLMAPDGTHTKLSEKEWIAARTDDFKKWMGFDWENIDNGHMVDESQKAKLARNGEPLEKYVQGYMERPRKPGKPKKKESETMAEYFNRLRLWEQAVKDWPETEAQWKAIVYRHDGSALPDETAINEKWMQKYEEDLAKWKVDNALPADAEAPTEKPVGDDADPLEYMRTMADWRRSEALWKTAPDKRDYEREAEAEVYSMLAQLELRHHPMSYSARMKQAGASLSQLRHAVLTQKRYDKTTVQSVVDFAKNFMSMGFGDNIGRGDLESILTSVKRAVGARSIKDSVDDIMNKLVENHLRNLSNYLEKLTSIKDKRLNPTGVEVQGELDLEGQRAIAEFRRVRVARMTPQDINTRLDELASKIMNDPENRSQWEAEFDGARAALIYMEGVAANKKACADAENAIKDAEREYKNSGRSYAAQQELLESLHKGLTDLLFERIDLYGQLFGELGTLLGDSRERAHDFRESEKLRVFNIHRMAAIDMAGKDANEIHPTGLKQALNNSALVRLPLCTLGTFEQMLKQFASRTPNGEGMLYNHFMRGFIDATNKEEEGLEAAKGMLDAKVSEVYGRKMQWSDLYLKERFLPTLDVTWRDGEGNQHTYTLSQGNMLAIYMWNKMHDGQMKLRKMDIVDSDVNRIAERIDPKLITLADWIQEEFLPTLRTKYNKVHEQEFGAAMAEIENYFPLRIVKDSIQREEDLTADPNADSVLPSTTTGSIIKRTVNAKPLDILNTDALSLVIEHIEEMEKWAAFTHWNKDVNTLLSYNRFKNQVKNMDTIYGSGEELWDAFRAACQMAAGTYRASHVKADKAMTVLAAGVTGAKIAFRPYTALKQLLSAPAFLSDANAENYAKYFMNPKNFFYENFKWGMENLPVLRKRWHSRDMGDTRLSDKTGFGYWHTQTRKWVAQYGMWANGMIDVLTCAAGARAVYETRLANYKKLGYDEAEAKEKALQDAAIAYNLTQQSSEGAFVSQIQKDRTLFANMWTVFRNSPAAYTRQSVDAIRNLKRLYSNREDMLHLMEVQFKEDGFAEAQAKSNARAEYKRAIWKNMAKLAVCALILPWFWELGSKVPYLIFGDDDELKKRMLGDVTRKELISGPTEGLTFGSATSTLIGAATDHEVMEDLTAENVIKAVSKSDVQPLPMFGDMATMFEKFGYDEAAGLQDLVNIACQIGTGVNPKTLTDPIEASIDACRGDMTKAKEIELFIMRVIMVPNESAQNIYLDEIGMDAKSAKELGYDKLAERYADYMFGKNTPMFGWVYSDEAEKKRRESYLKRFDKEFKDRVHLKDDATLQQEFEGSTSQKERKLVGREAAARQDSDDYYAKNKGNSEKSQKARAYYMSQRSWSDLMEDLELERLNRDAKANGNQETLEAIKEARQDINELITELPDDKESWQRLRERRKQVLDDLRTKK